jgi:hypothetical protein
MIDAGKLIKRIQEMRDEGYLSDAILRESVKQIKASDVDYNFVGVYLFNPDEQILWLHNYMGDGTEHARIDVGQGICGTAVAENAEPERGRRLQGGELPGLQPEDQVGAGGADPCRRRDLRPARHRRALEGRVPEGDQEAVELVADKLSEVFMAERR